MRWPLIGLGLIAACSPQDVATDISRRTAATVVYPVVNLSTPGPRAEAVTDCIVQNATPDELNLLIRDVGTRAGTSTVANVKAIAARPATAACIDGRG